MPSPDELIAAILEDGLKHEYDPQKAHEYYLRTRDLKGRSRGMDGDGSTSRMPAAQPAKSTPRKSSTAKVSTPRKVAPKETIEQRRARIKAATEQLKAKLEQLREVLRQLVNEAKVRSGGEETKNGGSTQPETASGKPKTDDLTPAEKAEQAKKAHDYYEKHKQETPEESITALQEKIAKVEERIRELRAKIAQRKAVPVGGVHKTQ